MWVLISVFHAIIIMSKHYSCSTQRPYLITVYSSTCLIPPCLCVIQEEFKAKKNNNVCKYCPLQPSVKMYSNCTPIINSALSFTSPYWCECMHNLLTLVFIGDGMVFDYAWRYGVLSTACAGSGYRDPGSCREGFSLLYRAQPRDSCISTWLSGCSLFFRSELRCSGNQCTEAQLPKCVNNILTSGIGWK